MRAVIFANGEFRDDWGAQGFFRAGDLVIGADGGTRNALSIGVTPDVVIGDLDSLSSDELAAVRQTGSRVVRFSPRKDETDLELALLHAAAQGPSEIIVLAAIGGRLDQTIANLMLLALPELRHLDVQIVDGRQRALIIPCGTAGRTVSGRPGDTVSLIPLGGDVCGVMTRGLEWALKDETLVFSRARGVSNVLAGCSACIHVREGVLLCIVIGQE
jgi:thiamine pyrophosphokinase